MFDEEQYQAEKQAERDAATNNESRKEGIKAIHKKIKEGAISTIGRRLWASETITNLNKQIAEYEVKVAMHKASSWSKACSKCKITKPSEEFSINQNDLRGRAAKCKKCFREEYANNKSV